MDFTSRLENEAMVLTDNSQHCVGNLSKRQTVILTPSATFSSIIAVCTPIVLALGFGWIVVPAAIKFQIASKAVISSKVNPDLYSAWIQPPIPVYLKVYLFNVTNPEDIKRGSQPKLKEIGPYVFLENRTKINIQHNEDTDTISYLEKISYHFDQTLSGNLELKDEITIINIPYAAAAFKIDQTLPWPMDSLAKTILNNYKEPLFIRRSVEETLFKGWVVQFLNKMEDQIGITLVPNNLFGILMDQNNTVNGPYKVARGTTDKSLFGKILEFRNSSKLDYWQNNSSCNLIKGTDGTLFPPDVRKNSALHLFNADLCRSIYLTYNESVNLEGVQGYRFTAPQTVLGDPTLSEENRCFCPYVEDEPDRCIKRGALDLGPCREGAPIAVSTPHFLDADPQYAKDSGLVPDRAKHETFMEIEPATGIIMNASKRIQINLILKRLKETPAFSKVPELLFPLVWVDEGATIDKVHLEKLKSILFYLTSLEFIAKWLVPWIAGIILIFSRKKRFNDEGRQNAIQLRHKF